MSGERESERGVGHTHPATSELAPSQVSDGICNINSDPEEDQGCLDLKSIKNLPKSGLQNVNSS